MATDNNSTSKSQAWFCTTGLPSDILVDVQDMSFHLHKFPLMSKSKKLHDLITAEEQNLNTVRSQKLDEESSVGGDEIEEVHCQIILSDFPGGSDTFEMVAKFCYGVKIDLNASAAVLLRCAGEYLSMTEEFCEENLISKTERFLSSTVLKSLHDSIKALKSCERVASLAETLAITQRCIDSIVSKACSSDPSLFGWPVTDNNNTANDRRSSASTTANSWIHDLAMLNLEYFTPVIKAMQQRDLSSDIIETCLIHYAKKHIPGVSRSNRKQSLSSASTQTDTEQRELLETLISNLPLHNISRSSNSAITRFLFGLLKTAIILNSTEQCRLTLEKKIGSQLDKATLDDLLIPSYSYLNETLYDVDCFERILGFFLNEVEDGTDNDQRSPELMLVGKLVDEYLAEIASDANLKPDRFYDIAVSLPEQARLFDDGLYRAVDIFLKAHPRMTETEKEKICGLLDYQKLTLEACTHAAQNERLPLRSVVQVLFFEQLQLRHAIAGTLVTTEERGGGRVSIVEEEEEVTRDHVKSTWRAAVRENQVMRVEMDNMRMRVHQLERECSNMKKVIEKVESNETSTRGTGGWRESLSKKFGCKFKIQVFDSHEQTVVNMRRGRDHHKQQ